MLDRIELAFCSALSRLPSPSARRTGLDLCSGSLQYFLPTEKHVHQRTDHKQLMPILLQSSVTKPHEAEFQLHHLKHVLHLRPHARFGPVLGSLLFVNLALISITTVRMVLRERSALLD